MLQLFKLPDGSVKALVEGQERVRIERFEATDPHFLVELQRRSTPPDRRRRAAAAWRAAWRPSSSSYVQLHPQLADEVQ